MLVTLSSDVEKLIGINVEWYFRNKFPSQLLFCMQERLHFAFEYLSKTINRSVDLKLPPSLQDVSIISLLLGCTFDTINDFYWCINYYLYYIDSISYTVHSLYHLNPLDKTHQTLVCKADMLLGLRGFESLISVRGGNTATSKKYV